MAAAASSYLRSNLQGGRPTLASAIFAKGNRILCAAAVPARSCRKRIHSAAPRPLVDENPDDGIRPAALVPDDVILGVGGSDKHYWAPNPATGVFGPASAAADHHHHQLAAAQNPAKTPAGASSVLDQHAWFRTADGIEY